MRTSELKTLFAGIKNSQASIYSIYYNFKHVNIDNVSDEMVKVSYYDQQNNYNQLFIQLDSIVAVEKNEEGLK